MPIHKRTYPSGKQSWQVDYRDASGKRRYKICPTLAHAKNFETKVLREKFEEKELNIQHEEEQEWNSFTKRFLRFSNTNKKHQTYRSHKLSVNHWTNFLQRRFPRGAIYISDITLGIVEEYKDERIKKVSPATLNRELACLKYMFTLAEDWDISTTIKTKKIKLLKEPPGRLRYLSEEEMKTLINSAVALHIKVFYAIAFSTGMRKGEILALKWEDIDLKNGIIQVKRTKSEKGIIENSTKPGKSREVFIPIVVCDVLKWWKEQIGKEYKIPPHIPHYFPPVDEEWLFTISDVRSAHKTACKHAKIKNFHIHDCRHTAATLFRKNGTELDTLMNILGHSTIRMTMRYAHVGSEEKRETADSIGYLLATQDIKTAVSTIKPATKKPQG